MLIDERAAKLKFCPFGRGAMPLGKDSTKFASGINMSPNGPLTTCEGSGCMLWETHNVLQEKKQLDCPDCSGKGGAGCAKCAGSGKYDVTIPHSVGFCGAGFNGPNNAALVELGKGLTKLTGVVAQALKITVTETPPAPPGKGDGETA